MENPWSRNYEGAEDEENNRQSLNGSSNAVNTEEFVQGVLRNSSSIDPSRAQNLTEINQPAAGAEPVGQQKSGERQPADLSSADSHHSKRNIPEDTAADPRAKKRAYDKAYRERVKENQKLRKCKLETLEGENESLKRENETLSRQLDELKKYNEKQHENEQEIKYKLKTLEGENESIQRTNETLSKELDELKKMYGKQHSYLKGLEAENESLKKEIVLVNKKFESKSRVLDELKKKYQKQQEVKSNLETLETEYNKLREKYKRLRESRRQLKSNLKTKKAEMGLMDRICQYVVGSRRSETQSNQLSQPGSKWENLEKELASTKTGSQGQSLAGQDLSNMETEGSMQSSQIITASSTSPACFPSGASSPAIGSTSPPSFCNSTPVVLPSTPTKLSPLGKACARMDLTAVHDILLKIDYSEEELSTKEPSFEQWTQLAQNMLDMKKSGDVAFQEMDFQIAIDYYSKSKPSGTVLVRRAFSYLMIGHPEQALRDAREATVCLPEWPPAFYMQALALSKLGMEVYALDFLNQLGARFEAKR